MVLDEDVKRILEKYEGKVITKELIGMFICPSWADDIEKYYKTEKKDDDGDDGSGNKKL